MFLLRIVLVAALLLLLFSCLSAQAHATVGILGRTVSLLARAAETVPAALALLGNCFRLPLQG